MTTITQHGPHATLINVFTVEPDEAYALAELLDEATDRVMRHVPGFVSANIHVSTDRTRVVNYAQWETAEAFETMLADETARAHMSKAAALCKGFDPHLYTVESVHGPAS